MGSRISIRDFYDDDLTADDIAADDRNQRRQRPPKDSRSKGAKPRRPPRTVEDQAFRCRKCRQFIGAPFAGGHHRNHCPNCLHSLHVDLKHSGDRRSTCQSLMAPRALVVRRNGEQMILHECLGCGKTKPTRVAADDNSVLLMRIPPIGIDASPDGITEAAEDIA